MSGKGRQLRLNVVIVVEHLASRILSAYNWFDANHTRYDFSCMVNIIHLALIWINSI